MEFEFNYSDGPRERPDTNGWHEIHELHNGWGWYYKKGELELTLYRYYLTGQQKYEDLTHDEKVSIVVIHEKKEKHHRRLNPPKPLKKHSGVIQIPMIKAKWPELNIEELINVQPMTGDNKEKK
jgi:hypothetical protein